MDLALSLYCRFQIFRWRLEERAKGWVLDSKPEDECGETPL